MPSSHTSQYIAKPAYVAGKKEKTLKHEIGELCNERNIESLLWDPYNNECSFNIMWRLLTAKLSTVDLQNESLRSKYDTKHRTWFQFGDLRRNEVSYYIENEFPGLKRFVGGWLISQMATMIINGIRLRQSKMRDANGQYIHPRKPHGEIHLSEAFEKKQQKRGRNLRENSSEDNLPASFFHTHPTTGFTPAGNTRISHTPTPPASETESSQAESEAEDEAETEADLEEEEESEEEDTQPVTPVRKGKPGRLAKPVTKRVAELATAPVSSRKRQKTAKVRESQAMMLETSMNKALAGQKQSSRQKANSGDVSLVKQLRNMVSHAK